MELRDYIPLVETLRAGETAVLPLHCLGNPEEGVAQGLIANGLATSEALHLEGAVLLAASELLQNSEQALFLEDFIAAEKPEKLNPEFLQRFARSLADERDSMRAVARRKAPRMELAITPRADSLEFCVSNDGRPRNFQEQRIAERLAFGVRIQSLDDLNRPDIATEYSGGSGLVLAAFALGRIPGASPLEYASEERRTLFRFAVPRGPVDARTVARIEAEVLAEIDALPAFPRHIRRLMELCEDAQSDLQGIVSELQQDPAIAGQIIRLANSGGFAGGRVASLDDAVKIVGLKNISRLLLQIGALGILLERYGGSSEIQRELVDHPVQVGFFARSLARRSKQATIADEAYVAGLLHDIGKAVLLAAMPPSRQAGVQRLAGSRDRRSEVQIEELAAGASHAAVGGLLARKWSFPDRLAEAIAWHHAPFEAPDSFRELALLVYLSNAMVDYLEGRISFYVLDPAALARFNLTSEQAFQMLAGALTEDFEERSG